MRKILALLAITGISTALSAQQNDFFDIQKYLQKKQKDNKPVYKLPMLKPSLQNQFSNFESGNLLDKKKFSHTLANGDRVYILLQDNMPCVIPDMGPFRTPNVSYLYKNVNPVRISGNLPGQIPNASIPKRISISK
jgi:hypothetical protein